jgi:putative tryptophan/tyrosine transport system substrate-binding protein
MKKLISLLILLSCLAQHCWAEPTLVAITQIVEHPALDAERDGIIEALKQAGYIEGSNLKVIYENAQGSIPMASQIAHQLISQGPKVIVALSTPSAQSVLGPATKQQIPVVFSAVTDPQQAKLTDHPLVTGVSDAVDLKIQIELIKKILPGIKKIGVIYNPGEANSVVTFKALQNLESQYQVAFIEAHANKLADAGTAFQSLLGKVEALLIPNDNTAVAAMSQLVQLGIKHKLPVFALDQGSIQAGAIAGYVVDRVTQGKKAGEKVIAILQGQSPDQLSIELISQTKLMVNKETAGLMGVTIPEELLNSAIKVKRS